MRMGGTSREGMNFWYDIQNGKQIFYAQYGQRSLRYEVDYNDRTQVSEARAWRKDVYARAEHALGIVRGRTPWQKSTSNSDTNHDMESRSP